MKVYVDITKGIIDHVEETKLMFTGDMTSKLEVIPKTGQTFFNKFIMLSAKLPNGRNVGPYAADAGATTELYTFTLSQENGFALVAGLTNFFVWIGDVTTYKKNCLGAVAVNINKAVSVGDSSYFINVDDSDVEEILTDLGAEMDNLAVTVASNTGRIASLETGKQNKLTNGDITTNLLAEGAVTSDKIATGAVNSSDIASNAVTTPKINNGAVTSYKLADGAVTENKIAAGAVTTEKLGAGSVYTGKIVDKAVTRDKLSQELQDFLDDIVTSIPDGSVTTAKIVDGAVTTPKIADESITKAKLSQALQNDIDDIAEIKDLIPDDARSSNKLTTESEVNDKINSVSAYYITSDAQGNAFASVAALTGASVYYSGGEVRVPTRNDYAYVMSDENHNGAATRYSYQRNQWEFQFIINESPMTQAQIDALNSGITSTKVGNYDNHLSNTNNPHNVTKGQVGLGNVDNTSDMNKPVSTAQQTALDLKLNKSDIITNWGYDSDANVPSSKLVKTNLDAINSQLYSDDKTNEDVSYKAAIPNTAKGLATLNMIGALCGSRNLIVLNDVAITTHTSGITYKIENGVITLNGTATSSANLGFKLAKPIARGVYSFNIFAPSGNELDWSLSRTLGGTAIIVTSNYIFNQTATDTMLYLWCSIESGTTFTNYQISPMVIYYDGNNLQPYSFEQGKLETKECAVTSIVSKDGNNNTIATLNIPAQVQALNGYGWGANSSANNHIDFINKLFKKSISRVDLGSLNYTYYADGNPSHFEATLTGVKDPAIFQAANMVCGLYTSVSVQHFDSDIDMGMCIVGTTLAISNSNYTDATTFKNAMSGVYLYYEMSSESDIDISEYLTETHIPIEPNGTLTFDNTYEKDVPHSVTYDTSIVEMVKTNNQHDIEQQARIEALESNKQDKSNLVTSISSSSTDTEYPSAKAVYDSEKAISDRVTALEGRTWQPQYLTGSAKSVLVPNDAFPTGMLTMIGGKSEKSENLIVLQDVAETTTNGITYSITNGVISLSGTATSTFSIKVNLAKEVYTPTYSSNSFNTTEVNRIVIDLQMNDTYATYMYGYGDNTRENITLVNSFNRLAIKMTSGETYTNVVLKPMLVAGSTAPTQFKVGYTGIHNLALTGVKVVGANIFDMNNIYKANAYYYFASQQIGGDIGNGISDSSYTSYLIEVEPNTTYYYTSNDAQVDTKMNFTTFIDSNLKVMATTSTDKKSITTPTNCKYILISRSASYSNVTCISRVNQYTPYRQTTLPIDLSTILYNGNPLYEENAIKGINGVLDTVEPTKAVKRIGRVDLGSLGSSSISYVTDSPYLSVPHFEILLSDAKTGSNNLLCSLYTTVSQRSDITTTNKAVCIWNASSNYAVIRDDSYTSVADFQTALSGVYLYFELATPIEVALNPELYNPVLALEHSGTVSFENTNDIEANYELMIIKEV